MSIPERLGYDRTSYRFARTIAAMASLMVALVACGGGDGAARDSGVTAASRDCGGTTTISEDGIGALRVNASVDSVRAACDVVRDTTALASEGMTARTLVVRIGGDSVAAVVVNDRVRSISIESSRFETLDSLGVGTPVSRMLLQAGADVFGGEGNVAITTATHCGMSFLLPRDIAGRLPIPTMDAVRNLPASAAVARVLVFPCIGASDVAPGTVPPEIRKP